MASLTFLTLVNSTLRMLNEVEIAETDFNAVRGVQATAKSAVRFAVNQINQKEFRWPFNAAENTQNLTVGVTEYVWPANFKIADFHSFRLVKLPGTLEAGASLKYLERDRYYEDSLIDDENVGGVGSAQPQYVYPTHGSGWGVTPSPDRAYRVKFRYWLGAPVLTGPTSDTRIPEAFEHVVVDGALGHMYKFKDDDEGVELKRVEFREGIKEMRTLLINQEQTVTDTRIRF